MRPVGVVTIYPNTGTGRPIGAPELSRHELSTRLLTISEPPPKPSLKLIIARGPARVRTTLSERSPDLQAELHAAKRCRRSCDGRDKAHLRCHRRRRPRTLPLHCTPTAAHNAADGPAAVQ